MTRYALSLSVGAVVVLLGLLGWSQYRAEALRGDLDTATRTIAALEEQARLHRVAAQVAAAARDREAAIADEYRALRATLTGDDDAPLPAWLAGYLRQLDVDVLRQP